MSLISAKSYINLTILYSLSDDHIPFHMSNDGSNGIYPFSVFSRSDTYRKIDAQQGKPYWFRSDDEPLIQNNKYPKIAMGRMVRDLNDYHNIGLLVMFVNEKYIRNLYADNLQTNGGSIAIVDGGGTVISHGGPDFYPVEGRSARFVADSAPAPGRHAGGEGRRTIDADRLQQPERGRLEDLLRGADGLLDQGIERHQEIHVLHRRRLPCRPIARHAAAVLPAHAAHQTAAPVDAPIPGRALRRTREDREQRRDRPARRRLQHDGRQH